MNFKRLIPTFIRKILIDLRFNIKSLHLATTKKLYKFTDEELKFTYLVAFSSGHNGLIPPVFFEFGCHSGRTFSSINSSNYLNIENASFCV